jgi:Protein of unknown function (DUF3455)
MITPRVLLIAAILLSQSALAQMPALSDLPTAIQPAAGFVVYLEVRAIGAQIYTCGKTDAGAWTWTFKAPEALLVDQREQPLGKHYAGPTWEGLDGGKVVGTLKASAPSPDNSIPWLLLDIKSREGTGDFTKAQAILRVTTKGGVAPSSGCDAAHVGTEKRVPYTATYLFLK